MSMSRTAYVVDDDRDVRMSLNMVLRSAGIGGTPFASAADFLDSLSYISPGCLLVDVRMPSMNGISLLRELDNRGVHWPAIVMTGDADLPSAVAALRLGVVDFLQKPFDDAELLAALERCFQRAEERNRSREGSEKLETLSPREKDVLDSIMRGETSKHAARRLSLSPRTVEMHRARMMRKLGVKTASGTVAVAATAGYPLDQLLT